jgi:PIF1-like helicase
MMVIIDEISFPNKKDISNMNSKLWKLKQKPSKLFGGIDVIFCGDLCQLEPVGPNKLRLYAENAPEF